jgi:hypothetical protein
MPPFIKPNKLLRPRPYDALYFHRRRLLKAMGSQSAENRCKVPLRYKEIHGKELKAVIKSECGSRDFGTALQFLAVDPVHAECDMVDKACKGSGLLLFSIICGRSNKEIDILKVCAIVQMLQSQVLQLLSHSVCSFSRSWLLMLLQNSTEKVLRSQYKRFGTSSRLGAWRQPRAVGS